MKKDTAERVCKAMNERLGDKSCRFELTKNRRTWGIKKTFKSNYSNTEIITEWFDEESIIHYLIGYAGEWKYPNR